MIGNGRLPLDVHIDGRGQQRALVSGWFQVRWWLSPPVSKRR